MAVGIDRMAARAARCGSTNRRRIQRGHSIWSAHLGRLPAAGDRADRKPGAHADDGLARAGLLLLPHRQRPERKGLSDAGRQAVEQGGGLQYDAAPNRGRAAPLLQRGVEDTAAEGLRLPDVVCYFSWSWVALSSVPRGAATLSRYPSPAP